jgi:hypothetical protein
VLLNNQCQLNHSRVHFRFSDLENINYSAVISPYILFKKRKNFKGEKNARVK